MQKVQNPLTDENTRGIGKLLRRIIFCRRRPYAPILRASRVRGSHELVVVRESEFLFVWDLETATPRSRGSRCCMHRQRPHRESSWSETLLMKGAERSPCWTMLYPLGPAAQGDSTIAEFARQITEGIRIGYRWSRFDLRA
jgi:hypothetical protein